MLARQLGFVSSWKMLTRERGWLKPVCLLALIGWVPVVGQIAIFGYALEWARVTAWGVDAIPKQRGIDYRKVLKTGARAYAVYALMLVAIGVILSMLTGHQISSVVDFVPLGAGQYVWGALLGRHLLSSSGLFAAVIGLLLGAVILAAMMRAVLYDSFGAGWRLDRIAQMIERDPFGFFKTWVAGILGAAVAVACVIVLGTLVGSIALGGTVSMLLTVMMRGYLWTEGHLLQQIMSMDIGPLIIIVALAIAALLVFGMVAIAMQLVTINVMGQWFCRFEVERWGVSDAPLPTGVPVRAETAPAWSASSGTTATRAAAADSYWDEPISPQAGRSSAAPRAASAEGASKPAEASSATSSADE